MITLSRLINKTIRNLIPYQSARRLFSGGRIWLNANESPYANTFKIDDSLLNRYPDCQPEELLQAYADYAGLDKSQVIATRGADEGIELLIRAFCTPLEDSVLICPPTYGMYEISAQTQSVYVRYAPQNGDFGLDLELIKSYRGEVKVIFICSPNNPTGNVVPKDQIQTIVEHFKDDAIVVVDEAYIEFTPQDSWASLINQYDNLVVLRTLSKAFALAGIRCGFTLAHPDIINTLLKVIAPYPVSAPVAQIACQALSSQGLELMRAQVNTLVAQKQWMTGQLHELKQVERVFVSTTNFILFRCQKKDQLMQTLVDQGILLRDQSKQKLLDNCLRITVGSEQENRQVMAAIQQFYQQEQA